MITELVPRSQFAAATRLDMVEHRPSARAAYSSARFRHHDLEVPPVFAHRRTAPY